MNNMNTLDVFLDDTRRAALRAAGDLQDAIAMRQGDETPEAQDAIARIKAHLATLEILRQNGIA